MSRGLVVALLALAATGAAAEGAASLGAVPVSSVPAEGAGKPVRLSDRRTVSRWAYPAAEAVARASPSAAARAVGRLRFLTSDQQAELYLALASTRDRAGERWIRVELPGRPNGRSGWVPAGALGPLHEVRGYLRIDRKRLRATLYRDGRAVFSARVGVGKPGTPTPGGEFYVMEKLTALRAPVFGPFAIGTSAYAPTLSEWPGGGVVGIHGTNQPQLIPGRPSHGCIRMRNADITRLWRMIALGTPIQIG
jgi:L,D-transpeptidase catalytic domain